MKRILLLSAALTLLSSTPLMAEHRSRAVCRIDHPAYYYQSRGYRPHARYRSRHFLTYHDAGRFRGGNRFYRGGNRFYGGSRFYRGGSRFYRGGSRFYRGGRGYYRSLHPRRSFRRFHRRPRIGIYVEF